MRFIGATLMKAGRPADRFFLVSLPVGLVENERRDDTKPVQANAMPVHGEHDVTAPLEALMHYAWPIQHPIVVVSHADHLMDGHIHRLKALFRSYLNADDNA